MTKAKLIEALSDFSNDADILLCPYAKDPLVYETIAVAYRLDNSGADGYVVLTGYANDPDKD